MKVVGEGSAFQRPWPLTIGDAVVLEHTVRGCGAGLGIRRIARPEEVTGEPGRVEVLGLAKIQGGSFVRRWRSEQASGLARFESGWRRVLDHLCSSTRSGSPGSWGGCRAGRRRGHGAWWPSVSGSPCRGMVLVRDAVGPGMLFMHQPLLRSFGPVMAVELGLQPDGWAAAAFRGRPWVPRLPRWPSGAGGHVSLAGATRSRTCGPIPKRPGRGAGEEGGGIQPSSNNWPWRR